MELQTKYITLDEFKEYTGIDLEASLVKDDNPSNTALAFLKRIEVRMEAFINGNFNRNIDKEYREFSDYQKQEYKYALLEQALYIFRNGDISVDSGYDPEKGEVISGGKIRNLSIAPNAKDHLRTCGIWNRNIGRNFRTGWFFR